MNEVYGALKFLEQDLIAHYDPEQRDAYVTRLNAIEKDSLALKIPKSLISDYYSLRSTIDFMRSWIQRTEETTGAQSATDSTAGTPAAVTAGGLAAAQSQPAADNPPGASALLAPVAVETPNAGQVS